MVLSPNNKHLLLTTFFSCYILDLKTMKIISAFKPGNNIDDAVFLSDNKTIMIASKGVPFEESGYTTGRNNKLISWDFKNNEIQREFNLGGLDVYTTLLDVEKKVLFVESVNYINQIKVYSLYKFDFSKNGSFQKFEESKKRTNYIFLSKSNKYIISTGYNNYFNIREISSGKITKNKDLSEFEDVIYSIKDDCYITRQEDSDTIVLKNIFNDNEIKKLYVPLKYNIVETFIEEKKLQSIYLSNLLQDSICKIDINSGEISNIFSKKGYLIRDISLMNNGLDLLIRDVGGSTKSGVLFWDDKKNKLSEIKVPEHMSIIKTYSHNFISVEDKGYGIGISGENYSLMPCNENSIEDIKINENEKYFISSYGKRLDVRESLTGIEIISIYPFENGNWVVMTPDGRFDASKGGLEFIHCIQGLEIIPNERYYDKFYTPNLLSKTLNIEK